MAMFIKDNIRSGGKSVLDGVKENIIRYAFMNRINDFYEESIKF